MADLNVEGVHGECDACGKLTYAFFDIACVDGYFGSTFVCPKCANRWLKKNKAKRINKTEWVVELVGGSSLLLKYNARVFMKVPRVVWDLTIKALLRIFKA